VFRDPDFFSISTLKGDKALRWSLLASAATLGAVTAALVYLLSGQTVFVDKIADVKVISEQAAKNLGEQAAPISQIVAEVGKNEPAVLSGYAANVVDVCQGSATLPDHSVILLTRAADGFAAVTTKLDAKTCELLSKNKDKNKPVWAVADAAFEGVESKPAYVMLNGSGGDDFTPRRLDR
jgi:hypothetical protein